VLDEATDWTCGFLSLPLIEPDDPAGPNQI